MTDNLDKAAELAQLHLDNSLAKHANREKRSHSSLYCIVCEDVIPETRRMAVNTELCIDCQRIEDMKRKQYGTT